MSNANIGWLFTKDYFNAINYADLENDQNSSKIKAKVQNIIAQTPTLCEEESLGNTRLEATTTYPGLLLGAGNKHELPSVEGQAILGFHFDYTSGLPVIQGSSIKGVLRSAFKHPEYIEELLENETLNVQALEAEIFDNADIFYDANIVSTDSTGKVLGEDYLTPHESPLKDPVPLRFVKVLPDVKFLFSFHLTSSKLLSKSKKLALFRSILEDLGLGAKTNVGYGKFDNFKKVQTKEEQALEKEEREEEQFNEAIAANDLELLEAFKRNFPHTSKDINAAIEEIKHNEKVADIARAFEKIKSSNYNAKFVKSFVEKYKDNPDAKSFITEIENHSTGKTESIDFENDVLSFTKYKQFEAKLKAYIQASKEALSEAEKLSLEAHIQNNMKEKIKRNKFPFGTLGNDKCLGKDRANALADTLTFK